MGFEKVFEENTGVLLGGCHLRQGRVPAMIFHTEAHNDATNENENTENEDEEHKIALLSLLRG